MINTALMEEITTRLMTYFGRIYDESDHKIFAANPGLIYQRHELLTKGLLTDMKAVLKETKCPPLRSNDFLLASLLTQAAETLDKYMGPAMVMGLLIGGLSYMDFVKCSVTAERWDLEEFVDDTVLNNTRDYYKEHGNDLSCAEDLDKKTFQVLSCCMEPVVLYLGVYGTGRERYTFDRIADMFQMGPNMLDALKSKMDPYLENDKENRKNLFSTELARRMRLLGFYMDKIYDLYPSDSLELLNLAYVQYAVGMRNYTNKTRWGERKTSAKVNITVLFLSDLLRMDLPRTLAAGLINGMREVATANVYNAVSPKLYEVPEFPEEDEYYKFLAGKAESDGEREEKVDYLTDDAQFSLLLDTERKKEVALCMEKLQTKMEDWCKSEKSVFMSDRLFGKNIFWRVQKERLQEFIDKEIKTHRFDADAKNILFGHADVRDFLINPSVPAMEDEKGAETILSVLRPLYGIRPDEYTVHKDENPIRDRMEMLDPNAMDQKVISNSILLLRRLMTFQPCANIDSHGLERLLGFVTQNLQVNLDRKNKKKVTYPYSNLILVTEKEDVPHEMIRYIARALHVDLDDVVDVEAKNLLQAFFEKEDGAKKYGRFRLKLANALEKDDAKCPLLVVHDLESHPVEDPDAGTGNAVENEKRRVQMYKAGWTVLLDLIRNLPYMPVIIVTNKYVRDESYITNPEVYYRFFRFHVNLTPLSPGRVYKMCLQMLKDETEFTLAKGFEFELNKYFYAVYREADLKGVEFAKDLRNRILSRYYSTVRKNREITVDCIPKYNADVQTPDAILADLNDMVGMKKVKKKIQDIYTNTLAEVSEGEKKEEIKRPLHMMFTGNPGTGKTTVAQKMADLFFSMGIIKTRKMIESKPADFISPYKGVSAKKSKSVIDRAMGGVLFIDEAYGFADGFELGAQALQQLILSMENHANDLIVILAGYKNDMQRLLKTNEGLKSRIAYEIEFEDYTVPELIKIFRKFCDTSGYSVAPNAEYALESCIMARRSAQFFGNGREMRNLFYEVKEAWSGRIYGDLDPTHPNFSGIPKVFTKEDFAALMPAQSSIAIQDMIGLTGLKEKLDAFKKQVVYQKYLREHGMELPSFSMHMIFMGNPGTGKTTVAKMIAQDLYSVGILKTSNLVAVEKADLVSHYVGKTPEKTMEVIKKARGGVLFVDEAYSLADGDHGHGHEAVETFLTAMEEYKEDTIIIFAGYTGEMQNFLDTNPGIQSRIGYTFTFEDYTPEELLQIYDKKMKEYGFTTNAAARKKIGDIMEYFSEVPRFGNGRFVDHVIQQIILKRAARFTTKQSAPYQDITVKDIPTHKEIIETAPNSREMYDPATITKKQKKRTAVHETGHALISYITDKTYLPKSISVKSQSGSLGRVAYEDRGANNMTEQEVRNRIATLLAGRNAERLFFRENATGVVSDYDRAKRLAKSMVEDYAMGEIGQTTDIEILREEDRRCTKLLEENKNFMEYFSEELLKVGEISGKEFERMYKEFKKSGGKA